MSKFDYEIGGYFVQWNFDSEGGYEERKFGCEEEAAAFARQLEGRVRVQEIRYMVDWYE